MLAVTLPTPSQFRHVKARAPTQWGRLFVDAVDGAASSHRFQFRIQDPGPPQQVFLELQSLSNQGQILAESVEVVGIEIAVDFEQIVTGSHDHAEVATYLHEHMAKPPYGPHRLLYGQRLPVSGKRLREVRAASGRRAIYAALRTGRTLVIGEENANETARFYVKNYDSQAGQSYAPLPPDQHRARMERALIGEYCPIRTLSDWSKFRFETLAERFAMVLPNQQATPLTAIVRNNYGPALGKPDDPKKRIDHRRQSAPATKRDTPLNAQIRQALRNLTERIHRAESAGIRGIR